MVRSHVQNSTQLLRWVDIALLRNAKVRKNMCFFTKVLTSVTLFSIISDGLCLEQQKDKKKNRVSFLEAKNTASLVIFYTLYIHFSTSYPTSIIFLYFFTLQFNQYHSLPYNFHYKTFLHWAILASMVELPAGPSLSAKKWKRVHFNIGENLNYFTTLKYKKKWPKTQIYE